MADPTPREDEVRVDIEGGGSAVDAPPLGPPVQPLDAALPLPLPSPSSFPETMPMEPSQLVRTLSDTVNLLQRNNSATTALVAAAESALNPFNQVVDTFYCSICMDNTPRFSLDSATGASVDQSFTLQQCQHVFCKSCLQQYINGQIKEGQIVFKCFFITDKKAACNTLLSADDVSNLLEEEMGERYKYLKTIVENPDMRECPFCGHLQLGVAINPAMVCSVCSKKFCFLHSNAHSGSSSCAEYTQSRFQEEKINKAAISEYSQPCPGCGISVEKSGGCNHMKCPKCKASFCWLCGKAVTDGTFPNHYQWWNLAGCPNRQMGEDARRWTKTESVMYRCMYAVLFLIITPLALSLTVASAVLALPCYIVYLLSLISFFRREALSVVCKKLTSDTLGSFLGCFSFCGYVVVALLLLPFGILGCLVTTTLFCLCTLIPVLLGCKKLPQSNNASIAAPVSSVPSAPLPFNEAVPLGGSAAAGGDALIMPLMDFSMLFIELLELATEAAEIVDEIKVQVLHDSVTVPSNTVLDLLTRVFEERLQDLKLVLMQHEGRSVEQFDASYSAHKDDSIVMMLALQLEDIKSRCRVFPVAQCPPHISREGTVEIMAAIYEAHVEALEDAAAEVSAKVRVPKDRMLQLVFKGGPSETDLSIQSEAFRLFNDKCREKKKAVLEAHGVDSEGMRGALLKYSLDETCNASIKGHCDRIQEKMNIITGLVDGSKGRVFTFNRSKYQIILDTGAFHLSKPGARKEVVSNFARSALLLPGGGCASVTGGDSASITGGDSAAVTFPPSLPSVVVPLPPLAPDSVVVLLGGEKGGGTTAAAGGGEEGGGGLVQSI